ncbi:MAG: hypothetical protein H6733_13720 [Alphaproteobacteria bacterium]|nr:hypothetical protein [Alphaproteobacteria bacterium]
MHWTRAAIGLAVVLPVGVYAAAVGAVWWLQETLLFPGAYGLPDDPARQAEVAASLGATPLRLTTADGDGLVAWHYGHDADRLVIYFGGNYAPIEASGRLGTALVDLGWEVLAVSPRGWPGCDGTPGEAAFHEDARAAWAWATQTRGIAPDRVVLHGRSIGGGIVGTVLDEVHPAGFVLESTFDAIGPLARAAMPWAPVDLLLRHPLRTVDRAPHATAPVLQLHHVPDTVVPIARGRALAAALHDAAFVVLPTGAHDDSAVLDDPAGHAAWVAFLERVAPAADPAPPDP